MSHIEFVSKFQPLNELDGIHFEINLWLCTLKYSDDFFKVPHA